jgi:hypothetical protein
MFELIQLIKYHNVLTNKRPAVTTFHNMYVICRHTIQHLTHTAAARLVSYWTRPSRRYQLLAVVHLNAAARRTQPHVTNGSSTTLSIKNSQYMIKRRKIGGY